MQSRIFSYFFTFFFSFPSQGDDRDSFTLFFPSSKHSTAPLYFPPPPFPRSPFLHISNFSHLICSLKNISSNIMARKKSLRLSTKSSIQNAGNFAPLNYFSGSAIYKRHNSALSCFRCKERKKKIDFF